MLIGAKGLAAADFDEIWASYASIRSRLVEPAAAKNLLKVVHEFGYVASILGRALKHQRTKHKQVFLRAFSSDALHLLHVLLTGDARGGFFYLRSAIENFWRHVYFKDHHIEYRWLTNKPGYYATIEELRKYSSQTDEFAGLSSPLDGIARAYQHLSQFVHTSKSPDLHLRKTLAEIRLPTQALRDIVKDLRSYGRDLVLCLAVLHDAELNKLSPRERDFAINFLDRRRKQLRISC